MKFVVTISAVIGGIVGLILNTYAFQVSIKDMQDPFYWAILAPFIIGGIIFGSAVGLVIVKLSK